MMTDHGCWFCDRTDGDDWAFSFEWDTPVHLSCVKKVLKQDPYHQEAVLMAKEFGLLSDERWTEYQRKAQEWAEDMLFDEASE